MTKIYRVLVVAAEMRVRQMFTDPFMLFSAVAAPLAFSVTAFYVLRGRDGFEPVSVVVGAGLTGVWSVVLFGGVGGISDERWLGTLDLLAATPASLPLIMAGKILGNLAFSLLSFLVAWTVGVLAFGYQVTLATPLSFALALLAGVVCLWATGYLLSPLGILWPAAQRFLSGLEYPVYILAGFMVPIDSLPPALHVVSFLLPPYWVSLVLHSTSSALPASQPLAAGLAIVLALSIVQAAAGSALYRRVLRRGRIDGSLAYT